MAEPLGVGIVGVGWWGKRLAQAVRDAGVGTVVGCHARTPAAREAFARDQDCKAAATLEELVADPDVDAVLLATPHSTHADQVELAAAHETHVFVEKPLALTVADCRRAIAAAERAGVVLQVGHNRRREPANRRIRQLIDAGDLGMVHLVEATITVDKDLVPRRGWRSDPDESPLGGMTAAGVHMLDTFRYLAGPVQRVFAMSKQLWGAGRLDDATMLAMEFARGPLGHLSTSLVLPKTAMLSVAGTRATAWNDDGAHLYLLEAGKSERVELPVPTLDTVADEIAEFARCIRDGERPETGGAQALETVAVLEAAITSVRTAAPVDVREVR